MTSTLWNSWLAVARKQPSKTVLVEAETGRSSSAETLHRSAIEGERMIMSAASPLRARPIIAFCLPNSAKWFSTFLAIQKVGGIAVPLDASTPETAQKETASVLGASLLISRSGIEALPLLHPPRRPLPPEAAVIKMTSGSTGRPTPLFFPSRPLLADGANIISTMGIRAEDVNFAAIPLGHSYGLGNIVLPLLMQGTAAVTSLQYLPHVLAEEIGRFRPTLFPGVPTHFKSWSQSTVKPGNLAPIRLFISAGAPLKAEWARLFYQKYGKKIHNFYGSSETGGITFDRTGEATLTGRATGTVLNGVQVELSPESKVRVTSRAVGGRKTGFADTMGSSFELPDYGEWNAFSELVLTGRETAIIKIGGRRVLLAEVERILRSCPDIHDAIVFPPLGDEHPIRAAVETLLGRRELLSLLTAHAPPWKIPRRLLIRDALPRTSRGKLDREKILAMLGWED